MPQNAAVWNKPVAGKITLQEQSFVQSIIRFLNREARVSLWREHKRFPHYLFSFPAFIQTYFCIYRFSGGPSYFVHQQCIFVFCFLPLVSRRNIKWEELPPNQHVWNINISFSGFFSFFPHLLLLSYNFKKVYIKGEESYKMCLRHT